MTNELINKIKEATKTIEANVNIPEWNKRNIINTWETKVYSIECDLEDITDNDEYLATVMTEHEETFDTHLQTVNAKWEASTLVVSSTTASEMHTRCQQSQYAR